LHLPSTYLPSTPLFSTYQTQWQDQNHVLTTPLPKDALDISQGKIARFSAEANSFVFGEGELEFEVEENELTLTVSNLVGEFAAFIPDPALAGGEAGAGAGAEAGAGAGAGAGVDAGAGAGAALLDALQRLIAEGNAALAGQ
jgi:hypothetical protein